MPNIKNETSDFDTLPNSGYVRLSQLVPNVLPVCALTVNRLVKNGRFPAPVYIAPKCKAWRVGDVRKWLDNLQEIPA